MVRICMNEERVGETKQHQQKKIDREFFFFCLFSSFCALRSSFLRTFHIWVFYYYGRIERKKKKRREGEKTAVNDACSLTVVLRMMQLEKRLWCRFRRGD